MSAFQDFAIHDDQPQAPCLRCDEREAGCHATCRRYQLFRQICRAQDKKRRVESALDDAEERRKDRMERKARKNPHKT